MLLEMNSENFYLLAAENAGLKQRLQDYEIHTPEKINAALLSAQKIVDATFPSELDRSSTDQKAMLVVQQREFELRKVAIATAFRRIMAGENPCPAAQKPNQED